MPGMIVAPEPLAVEAGAQVLMAGGNAIDAAVDVRVRGRHRQPHELRHRRLHARHAAPGRCLRPNRRRLAFDAPALAGSKTTPDMWAAASLGPNPEGWGFLVRDRVNYMGYSSILPPARCAAWRRS